MNTFAQAVKTQEARTQNGMKALAGTGNACLDMFYKIGAMRDQDPTNVLTAALAENEDLALRIALWSRDVRGGAGERELFRKMLSYLEDFHPELALKLLPKVPELGRWDDIFVFKTPEMKAAAYTMLGDALRAQNGLAAKWAPREGTAKGAIAKEIREFFGMTPKQYRKSLVALTNVVEQQMCAKKWDEINFSHVPSVASSRYKKAFLRNAPEAYKSYIEKLVKKDDPNVKINANAIFPHDVIKDIVNSQSRYSKKPSVEEMKVIQAQWEALPDYIGDSPVLPMVDVSASMFWTPIGNGMYPGTIAQSLGLYCAEKNKGPFKDVMLSFSSDPVLEHLPGSIIDKLRTMQQSHVGGSTDVIKAMELILNVALKGGVKDEDMPKTLLILSDMQFNQCARYDRTAMEAIEQKFERYGYSVPNVVFWNLQDKGTVPVKADKSGAALVSGYSPSILKSVLSASDDFTPEGIMLQTVMIDRYALD